MTTTFSQPSPKGPTGMLGFTIVWAGQLVSMLGSTMSQFALTIWAYEKTGSALALGIVNTAFLIPFLLLSPIAGAMVDRYNRKLMMMLSDLFAITATVGILILNAMGRLEIWHLYIAAAINGLGNTFQWPAYSAAISTMVPKAQYSRANGMMGMVESVPSVLAPMLAGVLLPIAHLTGILTIDVVTFFLAIGTLMLVHVPKPERTEEGQKVKGGLLKEGMYGFKYIFDRKSLLGLLVFFSTLNFVIGVGFTVLAPFILTKTGNNSTALGSVQSAGAIGAVIGGLLISAWGGFKRRTNNIFLSEFMTGLLCLLLFGLGRVLPWWIIVIAIGSIWGPMSNGASQAIWQSKVAPDVQGRVFSARRMIAYIMMPITPLIGGALADYVLEPAMKTQSGLAKAFGWLVGTGAGSGMALQIAFAGLIYVVIVVLVYLFVPVIRNMEDVLPDHDQLKKIKT
jgi:MFS family permease